MSSLPLRYSMMWISVSSPLISVNAQLTASPLSETPSTIRWKLWPGYGSGRTVVGIVVSSVGSGGSSDVERLLLNPENHEFSGFDRCDADLADELAGVDFRLAHGRAVADDEERL